jgi:RimJ/RimL family protein N-acetyltransferase
MSEFCIETERLILREWREEDSGPFHVMSNDPLVMATLGPVMSREESDALIGRLVERQADDGYTFWAIERTEDQAFLGFCGIVSGAWFTPVEGKPEIGWRLAHHAWGQGYAREAALACLAWGFTHLADDAIWAITSSNNTRSWGLMERLGMTRHDDLDFDHPNVPDDSPLKQHVTYGIRRDQWPTRI